jgi:hypothetical protein
MVLSSLTQWEELIREWAVSNIYFLITSFILQNRLKTVQCRKLSDTRRKELECDLSSESEVREYSCILTYSEMTFEYLANKHSF